MKRLSSIAKANGETLGIREGGSHTVVTIGKHVEAVPRHAEISEGTARAILRRTEKALEEGV